MKVSELSTPALLIDADALDHNLTTMAAVLPGSRLRPHVKAHKCTSLAAAQRLHGHRRFTCATPREVVGMAAAGLGDDLLLANETLDPTRLSAMAALQDGLKTQGMDHGNPSIDGATVRFLSDHGDARDRVVGSRRRCDRSVEDRSTWLVRWAGSNSVPQRGQQRRK